MRKKDLLDALQKARARIDALENIICPAHQHDWFEDYVEECYVMLHTVIIEQNIGRYLYPDEVVHHKNHIRDDNRIKNLELMKKKDHCSMHAKERNSKKGELLSTV